MGDHIVYYRACFYVNGARAPWRTELVTSIPDLVTAIDDEAARLINEGLFADVRSVDIEKDEWDEPLRPILWLKGPWKRPRDLLREIKNALN